MRIVVLISFFFLALSAVADNVLSPFFVNIDSSWRTAYHSRGRVIEDRPMMMMLARTGFDSKEHGNFGKIGLWHWNVSSLSGRRDMYHRRPLNEMDYGIFWNYTIDFGKYNDAWKGWSLTSEILKDWVTLEGYTARYRASKTNASINEWRFSQSLNNPYITPFYLLRRAFHPDNWFYARLGVLHKFAITENLTFTPIIYTEFGDSHHFERRYGAQKEGGHYHAGLMALNLILEISWKISDMVSVYANVHQFHVADEEARDNIKNPSTPGHRRDLTIGTIGLRLRF